MSHKKLTIVLDMDEVIVRWLDRILEWWNEDQGTNIKKEDIKNYWGITDTLGPASEYFLRSSMRYIEMYRDLEPIPGALEGMKELIELGHDVLIVTSVPNCAGISYHGKLEWLRRNAPFFDLDNLIACHRKYLIDADVLVDDAAHNIIPWLKNPHRRYPSVGVIFDAPWNQGAEEQLTYEEKFNVRRVKNWDELIDEIDDFSFVQED